MDPIVYEQAKSVFESWGVSLEYATELFLKRIVQKKKYVLSEFENGRDAEDIISEIADEICEELSTGCIKAIFPNGISDGEADHAEG